jgi:uncharacterized protein
MSSIDSKISASIVLGTSIVLSAIIGGYSFMQTKNLQDNISVTGSAYQDIVSDSAKWRVQISNATGLSDLTSGNTKVKNDLAALQKYLTGKGITKDMITVAPVLVETRLDYQSGSAPIGYTLRQDVIIEGSDVEKITLVAQDASMLLSQGALVTTVNLEYFYSGLGKLRVELMAEAMKDAKNRADAIAESVGSSVGTLRDASMGVLQVTAVNSMDISDYGTYDTSALKKRVTAVVRAAFAVR